MANWTTIEAAICSTSPAERFGIIATSPTLGLAANLLPPREVWWIALFYRFYQPPLKLAGTLSGSWNDSRSWDFLACRFFAEIEPGPPASQGLPAAPAQETNGPELP